MQLILSPYRGPDCVTIDVARWLAPTQIPAFFRTFTMPSAVEAGIGHAALLLHHVDDPTDLTRRGDRSLVALAEVLAQLAQNSDTVDQIAKAPINADAAAIVESMRDFSLAEWAAAAQATAWLQSDAGRSLSRHDPRLLAWVRDGRLVEIETGITTPSAWSPLARAALTAMQAAMAAESAVN